jgi:hypothetical protein
MPTNEIVPKVIASYFAIWVVGNAYLGFKTARHNVGITTNDPYLRAHAGLSGAVNGVATAIPMAMFPPIWHDVGKTAINAYNGVYN